MIAQTHARLVRSPFRKASEESDVPAPRTGSPFHVPPSAGMQVLRDPETPPDRATLALRAVVDPPVEQWYVDGSPYQVPTILTRYVGPWPRASTVSRPGSPSPRNDQTWSG